MSRTYSAGIATAYGAAVRGGYTGTYEEFCAALGDLAGVLTEFENFRATAQTLAEGQEATASYTNGILTLGIPTGQTGNGIRSISLLSTVGLVKTYRITYTNDNVFDFPVADGKGIKSTVLNNDYTLTITYTDDTTWTSTSIRGEVGATPQFSIGTVETLLPTQPASATITGTPERPVLNMGIPQGAPGEVTAASMAPVYSTSGTYAVGDYVIHNGQLYKCTTAITTAEAWTAAHWTVAEIATDVSNLNRQLSDLEDVVSTTQIINTASGDIASFDDGADGQPIRKLVAQIEPVQDLNGYDNPWPAGGGKNLLDPSKRTVYSDGKGQRWYESDGFTLKANQAYTFSVTYANPISLYIRSKSDGTNFATGNQSITYTPSEDTVVYFQAYRGEDISSVDTFQLELGSTATAYSPYSNICPISGWTGAEIKQTGKNLIPNLKVQDTSIRVRLGESTVGNGFFLKAGTYKISWGWSETQAIGIYWRTYKDGVEGSVVNSDLITLSEDCNVRIWLYASAGISVDNVAWWQVELGSTATDYAPYTGNQISVDWEDDAGTVYGGTLDVISGLLTVDKVSETFDGSADETWQYVNASRRYALTYVQHNFVYTDGTTNPPFTSNIAVPIPQNVAYSNITYSAVSSVATQQKVLIYLFAGITDTLTIEEFKTWLSNNPLQVVYPLAEPQTYQLTPQELDTLLGTNNIWSDTGDTEVTYPADTKLYIDGKIAEAIAALGT